mmetsp:Transcript_130667/g.260728  ORF Transcript_130667/g.260728 Transcript_130667/m.260728 type:complete len:469 (+) Transcript_130667:75-1481(+)
MSSSDRVCVICLDSLSLPGKRCRALSCTHVLHEDCAFEMMRHGLPDTCPVCRRSCQDIESVESRFEHAFLCYMQKAYCDCAKKLEEVLVIDPAHLRSMELLGEMCCLGAGMPKDPKKAMDFLTVAADAGHPDAVRNLGLMYEEDDGVRTGVKKVAAFGANSVSQTSSNGVCRACGATTKLRQCARCKAALYCSQSCQRADWNNGHNMVCKQAPRSVPGTLAPRQERRAELIAELASSASEVSLPKASANPFDVEAGVAASLEEASGRTAPENAQIGDEIMRMRSCEPSSLSVVVIEFSPDGKWFLKALSDSPALESIRQPPLPSGAKVFIKPDWVCEAVSEHLRSEGWELKPRFVVTRAEHVELVVRVIQEAAQDTPKADRGGSSMRVKNRIPMDVPMPGSSSSANPRQQETIRQQDDQQQCTASDCNEVAKSTWKSETLHYIVKRTFVDIPIASSMHSELSQKAQTA